MSSNSEDFTSTRETFWIVDYDLPANSSRRRQFYRAVARYLKEHNVTPETKWSTQSVVITPDKEFAELVFDLASHVGQAHIYKGELISESGA